VIQAELDVALGGTMPDVTKASHLRAGLAVVTGRDEEETEARMRDLAAWFGESITVEPPAC
jgi:hypothetical protein